MRRIIPLSLLALIIAGGSALADRRDDHRNNHRHNYSQRDDRPHHSQRDNRPQSQRDYSQRNWNNNHHHHVHRGPVRYNNNHYHFHNGYSVRYTRPYIGVRYTSYRVRPVVLVENMQVVPGYVWIRGHWDWNGYEWIWNAGHYEVDASYSY